LKGVKGMKQGVFSFTEDVFSATQLKEGEDFEVVSMMILNYDFDFYSIDSFFDIDSSHLYQEGILDTKQIYNFFHDHQKMNQVMNLSKTPYPQNNERNIYFYKMKGAINFNHAISVGFGVVKMLRGKYKEEYLLYNFNSFIDGDHDLQLDFAEEILMLKIYAQLTYPNKYDDKGIEKLLKNETEYLLALLPGNPGHILRKLESTFNSKKGKVIPFIYK
jgi:hypothetical protein